MDWPKSVQKLTNPWGSPYRKWLSKLVETWADLHPISPWRSKLLMPKWWCLNKHREGFNRRLQLKNLKSDRIWWSKPLRIVVARRLRVTRFILNKWKLNFHLALNIFKRMIVTDLFNKFRSRETQVWNLLNVKLKETKMGIKHLANFQRLLMQINNSLLKCSNWDERISHNVNLTQVTKWLTLKVFQRVI